MLASLLLKTASSLPEWSSTNNILFIRAHLCPELLPLPVSSKIECLQSFYPDYCELQSKGLRMISDLKNCYSFILYCGTKFKEENIFYFTTALKHLERGGTFLCVLPNDLGAARFEKIFGSMIKDELFSYSKSKARVFGVRNFTGALEPEGRNEDFAETNLGIFSALKTDAGSALLAEATAGRLAGSGADLGAGVGLLSAEALKRNPSITSVVLFEAEKNSLDQAKKKLVAFDERRLSFEWSDVTRGIGENLYDWIISNPPFHAGKHARPELGISFIKTAAASLKVGGKAFIVQNKHLPYLAEARKLGAVNIIADRDGFIVWELQKP